MAATKGSYGKASRQAVEDAPVGSGADFFTLPTGETRIRVMPPWGPDVEAFWFATGTHFGVGPDERAVPCPELSGVSEKCYLCRLSKRLKKGDEDERQEGEAIGARPRFLLNIVDLDNPQNGVQVWGAPKTIFKQLRRYWLNEEDYGDFTSFDDEGFDILIEKTGEGLKTKYDATPTRPRAFPPDKLLNHSNSAVSELFQSLADQEFDLPDLAGFQKFLSDEEMERTYLGTTGGRSRSESKDDNGDNSDDDDDEEKKPDRSRSRQEEDQDEEPEEKPRRERKQRPDKDSGRSRSPSRVRGRTQDLDED